MIGPEQTPSPSRQSAPATDNTALAALQAEVETLAHELEALRHSHRQLQTYHHHLRFRLAERANDWLRRAPLIHSAARLGVVAAQAAYRAIPYRRQRP